MINITLDCRRYKILEPLGMKLPWDGKLKIYNLDTLEYKQPKVYHHFEISINGKRWGF